MSRNQRNPYSEFKTSAPSPPKAAKNDLAKESGAIGFFKDAGVRELIESLLVAFCLACIFRVFLAEAFIIPTGSMAPSLKGAHREVVCRESGVNFVVGDRQGNDQTNFLYCPITQHDKTIRRDDREDRVRSGDRIIVNKFVYDFKEPERFDVIVFKNPNNGKQNYIKRLIGLPGDNLLIENGDVYLMEEQSDGRWSKTIARKPAEKTRTTLQVVDDTYHIGEKLKEAGWPLRWQQYRGEKTWNASEAAGKIQYSVAGTGRSGWLRYRHFRPYKSDWQLIDKGLLPLPYRNRENLPAGSIIADYYAYNDTAYSSISGRKTLEFGNHLDERRGFHWVGDIGLEMDVNLQSSSGVLLLDLVEGGAHFTCEIDVASGQAKLSCDSPSVQFVNSAGAVKRPVAQTKVNRAGTYRILFVNADDRLHLWIDGRLVPFDAAEYTRTEIPTPQYSESDPGDAEPIGIATQDLKLQITRLKVVRDLYYVSAKGNENPSQESVASVSEINRIFDDPRSWATPEAKRIFLAKKGQSKPMFQLKHGATRDLDQFLPMGDNSPESSDGRVWDGPNYFERNLLIGRAIFVYFPAPLNKPLPFTPNFKDMRFIR